MTREALMCILIENFHAGFSPLQRTVEGENSIIGFPHISKYIFSRKKKPNSPKIVNIIRNSAYCTAPASVGRVRQTPGATPTTAPLPAATGPLPTLVGRRCSAVNPWRGPPRPPITGCPTRSPWTRRWPPPPAWLRQPAA